MSNSTTGPLPLPSADQLKAYDQVIPGLSSRLVELAEAEHLDRKKEQKRRRILLSVSALMVAYVITFSAFILYYQYRTSLVSWSGGGIVRSTVETAIQAQEMEEALQRLRQAVDAEQALSSADPEPLREVLASMTDRLNHLEVAIATSPSRVVELGKVSIQMTAFKDAIERVERHVQREIDGLYNLFYGIIVALVVALIPIFFSLRGAFKRGFKE